MNGAPAQVYPDNNPGTVRPGDVITSTATGNNLVYGYVPSEDAQPIKEGAFSSPMTVETVGGAVALILSNPAS